MSVAETVRAHGGQLTPAERRIATVVLDSPQIVGFGTVADLADEAEAGAATVVRFANKLGYDGFVGLQRAVRRDLSGQLRPAAERIREQRQGLDHVRYDAAIEQANVAITLTDIDTAATRAVVDRLADERSEVLVLSGAASRGVALQFVIELSQLRPGVSLLDGNPVDVSRAPGARRRTADDRGDRHPPVRPLGRRHPAAGVGARGLGSGGHRQVLSPLASVADHAYLVAAESPGPFDSHVGTLALLDVLVVGVAGADRDRATERLDRQESLWRATDALIDE